MSQSVTGAGSADDPWILTTPPGASEYRMHRNDDADPPELVCQVGSTTLRYLARCVEDVPAMLRKHGDWMELGGADENKPAKDGTLEAWARAAGEEPVAPMRTLYLQFGAEPELRLPRGWVVDRAADLVTELQLPVR